MAIISSEGEVTVAVKDGSFLDAGRGSVRTTGAALQKGTFSVTMVGGSKFDGRLDFETGFITGTLTGTASGTVLASNSSAAVLNDGSLRNLSARGLVTPTGSMVVGFVIGGSESKTVLIRGVGPTLAAYGVPSGSVQADPKLTVHAIPFGSPSYVVAQNDNWTATSALMAATNKVWAFPLAPLSKDAALLLTLPPGMYTATAAPATGASGVTLVELYDVDADAAFGTQKLMNISARGDVGTGVQTLHAGFVVSGDSSKRVLIRAVGPTLTKYGVPNALKDPAIVLRRLVDGAYVDIRTNDSAVVGNDAALVQDAIQASGIGLYLEASDTKSAEMLISLPPGTYSAEVISMDGTVGNAMVEVYEVP